MKNEKFKMIIKLSFDGHLLSFKQNVEFSEW